MLAEAELRDRRHPSLSWAFDDDLTSRVQHRHNTYPELRVA